MLRRHTIEPLGGFLMRCPLQASACSKDVLLSLQPFLIVLTTADDEHGKVSQIRKDGRQLSY